MAKKARKAAAISKSRRRAAGPKRGAGRAGRRSSRPARPPRRKAAKSSRKRVVRAPQPKARRAARSTPVTPAPGPVAKPARIERERRRLSDAERLEPAREIADTRMVAAARAGHDELRAKLQKHTETSPELTAGDIDARWQDAYSVGDETPGGDNPTPDQDRVDDIGKALGVQYQDNEELKGGEEIVERDHRRWELDPASSDDWPHSDEED
jgi:uncharacterized protein DUF6335